MPVFAPSGTFPYVSICIHVCNAMSNQEWTLAPPHILLCMLMRDTTTTIHLHTLAQRFTCLCMCVYIYIMYCCKRIFLLFFLVTAILALLTLSEPCMRMMSSLPASPPTFAHRYVSAGLCFVCLACDVISLVKSQAKETKPFEPSVFSA